MKVKALFHLFTIKFLTVHQILYYPDGSNDPSFLLMPDDAPPPMLLLLEGDLDGDVLTLGDHLLLALSPGHLGAVAGAADLAQGAPSDRAAGLGEAGQLLPHHEGHVGLHRLVQTDEGGHHILHHLVHQLALLPGLVSTVDVADEHLLSVLIDLPPGVTHLLGDIPALWHLLGLPQHCLGSIGNTFPGCEGVALSLVTPDHLLPPLDVAGVAGLHAAPGAGQDDADPLRPGPASPLHLVSADLVSGGFVLQLTVLRHIHTIIIVVIMFLCILVIMFMYIMMIVFM